jgi:DNA-directed RNA polymerase specialized sigma24 family protein
MASDPEGSVTHWLGTLNDGDAAAAQRLWERYFDELVRLARVQLGATPRAAADEQDVDQSAFHSFCAGAAQGRFPRLDDRDDLWRLLVTIMARHALDQVRRQAWKKRAGGRVPVGLAPAGEDPDSDVAAME